MRMCCVTTAARSITSADESRVAQALMGWLTTCSDRPLDEAARDSVYVDLHHLVVVEDEGRVAVRGGRDAKHVIDGDARR